MGELDKDYEKGKNLIKYYLIAAFLYIYFIYTIILEIIILSSTIYLILKVFRFKISYKNVIQFISPILILSVIPITYFTDFFNTSELVVEVFKLYEYLGIEPMTFYDTYYGFNGFIYSLLFLFIIGGVIMTLAIADSTTNSGVFDGLFNFVEKLFTDIKNGIFLSYGGFSFGVLLIYLTIFYLFLGDFN